MIASNKLQFSLMRILVVVAIVAALMAITINFGAYWILQIVDLVLVGLILQFCSPANASQTFKVTTSFVYSFTFYLLPLTHFFDQGLMPAFPIFIALGLILVPVLSVFGGLSVARSCYISLTLFAYRMTISTFFTLVCWPS